MPSRKSGIQLTGTVKAILHIDIWDSIFDQLALLGYHKTLADCALLSREHARVALRRLYGQQFLPSTSWGSPSTMGLWEALIFSTGSYPGGHRASALMSRPYLTWLRRLDSHNFHSVFNLLEWEEHQLFARALGQGVQESRPQQDMFATLPAVQLVNPPNDWHPSLLAARVVGGLIRLANGLNLRVMLKELTAHRWKELLPDIISCRQLERLSLDKIDDLDSAAADIISGNLPKLKHMTFIEAAVTHTYGLAYFVSHLKPDQLHSFNCSLDHVQLPLLRAIVKQRELQELGLHFLSHPPLELHILTLLTNLRSLKLSFNYFPSVDSQTQFRDWASKRRDAISNWLTSCKNLKSLHLFRVPLLIPAITDALRHLRLEKLHVFGTGYYGDFYRALSSQRLTYLFLAECPDRDIINPPLARNNRGWHVLEAVCAMPCLRDLRLHTFFPLTYQQLREVLMYVPKLETLSFVRHSGEDPIWTLRGLEDFTRLTSLTVLGMTMFSSRDILRWIKRTRCHLRPGGFSLSLPSQSRAAWFRGAEVPGYDLRREPVRDVSTQKIKELLKFFRVWVRGWLGEGETWRGNDYEFDEERMFVMLWGDIRGPNEALMVVKGTSIYPPYPGLADDMGFRLA